MRLLIAFDADKRLRKPDGSLAKPGVLRGEERLLDEFGSEFDVFTAEWDLASGKGIDDLLSAGGTPRLIPRYQPPPARPRVPRPCASPGPIDAGEALEAVQRETRERIERRFTGGYRGTVAVVAPPPGLAKTGSGLSAQEATGRLASWAVQRHAFAEELVDRTSTEPCACGKPRGSCPQHAFDLQHDEGRNEDNCSQFDLVSAAREAGYGPLTGLLICGTPAKPICPSFFDCSYQGQYDRPGSHVAPVQTVVQRPTSTKGRDVVICDDIDGSQLIVSAQITAKTIERARGTAHFGRVRELVELLEEASRQASNQGAFHDEMFELLDYVARQRGTTLEEVLARTPSLSGLWPEPTVDGFNRALPGQLVDLIGQLHQEFSWYREGGSITSGIRITSEGIECTRLMTPVMTDDGVTSLTSKAVLVLSSTPSPVVTQWTSHLGLEVVKPYRPKVSLPSSVRVIQDVAGFYGKQAAANASAERLLSRAQGYLEELGGSRPAVITHQHLQREAAERLGIPLERVLYFGNMRGSNAVRDADVLLVIGTPGMTTEDAYWQACAAYRGEGVPPAKKIEMRWQAYGGWRDARGRGREIEVRTFVDDRVAEIYESSRRDELIQAIYRCRPHDLRREGESVLTVVLLTAMPVAGLRVDELRFSGNAAKAEKALLRLDKAFEQLSDHQVTSRKLAEMAGTDKDRAAKYLSGISAACPPTSIKRNISVGGQGAETSEPVAPPACACLPCPANRADRCNCGKYWRDTGFRWHCGAHDPKPSQSSPAEMSPNIQAALGARFADSRRTA